MANTASLKVVPPPKPPARPEIPLLEYRGLLPEQAAGFLGGLSDWERRHVYVLLGNFEETRALIGTARLLHQYLREGPHSAARGRLTFQEFMDTKDKILGEILSVRRKVNEMAEAVSLRLPRVPLKKETPHAPQYRRVS